MSVAPGERQRERERGATGGLRLCSEQDQISGRERKRGMEREGVEGEYRGLVFSHLLSEIGSACLTPVGLCGLHSLGVHD